MSSERCAGMADRTGSRPTGMRFPIARPGPSETDARFTFGLLLDVRKVLTDHGYPEAEAADIVELQQALFRFIYGGARYCGDCGSPRGECECRHGR